jgi:hypothetical protein
MLKKIKKLLAGDPAEGIAAIDIAALEQALDAAQRKRAGLILDGEVDDILAAERQVDVARIELERGRLARAELERRKAEAEAQARRRARDVEREAAAARVERVTGAIAAKAKALAELDRLVGEAAEADRAAVYATQKLVDARVEGDLDADEEIFLPSVGAWLSTREAEVLPDWYRARLYEHVREWQDVR